MLQLDYLGHSEARFALDRDSSMMASIKVSLENKNFGFFPLLTFSAYFPFMCVLCETMRNCIEKKIYDPNKH